MKLVIVTAVKEFQEDVLKIFKKATIENFTSSDIDAYKDSPLLLRVSNYFSAEINGNESIIFFSFINKEKIDHLFNLIKKFNTNLETNNPLKATVVSVEDLFKLKNQEKC